jgi:hypothetical protein
MFKRVTLNTYDTRPSEFTKKTSALPQRPGRYLLPVKMAALTPSFLQPESQPIGRANPFPPGPFFERGQLRP